MLWVGSFLGCFHSTFSARQSQSLSWSHVWHISLTLISTRNAFFWCAWFFCCRSEVEAAPHLQQLLPVPRCIGTLDRFVETCWLLKHVGRRQRPWDPWLIYMNIDIHYDIDMLNIFEIAVWRMGFVCRADSIKDVSKCHISPRRRLELLQLRARSMAWRCQWWHLSAHIIKTSCRQKTSRPWFNLHIFWKGGA